MAEDTSAQYEYTVGNGKGLEFYILGDDIKNEFYFLKNEPSNEATIVGKMYKMLDYLKKACECQDAFYFENGSTVTDLMDTYNEIKKDVDDLGTSLVTLHSAIMTDIDNVNAELETNFGHWYGKKVVSRKK